MEAYWSPNTPNQHSTLLKFPYMQLISFVIASLYNILCCTLARQLKPHQICSIEFQDISKHIRQLLLQRWTSETARFAFHCATLEAQSTRCNASILVKYKLHAPSNFHSHRPSTWSHFLDLFACTCDLFPHLEATRQLILDRPIGAVKSYIELLPMIGGHCHLPHGN